MSTSLIETDKKRTAELVKTIKSQDKPHGTRCNALVDLASLWRDTYLRSFTRNEQDLFLSGLQAVLAGKNGPNIINCSVESIGRFIKDCSSYRFHIGGAYPDAYPVPFGKEVSTIVSWRGLVKLGARSGELAKPPVVTAVYEGEDLQVSFVDGETEIKHGYDPANPHRAKLDDSKIVAVYMVATFNSGAKTRLMMTREQIDAHKERYSKGWSRKDSAWQTNWGAMAFKTVLRVAFNRGLLPISVEDRRAGVGELIGRDDDTGDVIDATWEPASGDENARLPQTEDPNAIGIDPHEAAKATYQQALTDALDSLSQQAAEKAYAEFITTTGSNEQSLLAAWAAPQREEAIKQINGKRRAG